MRLAHPAGVPERIGHLDVLELDMVGRTEPEGIVLVVLAVGHVHGHARKGDLLAGGMAFGRPAAVHIAQRRAVALREGRDEVAVHVERPLRRTGKERGYFEPLVAEAQVAAEREARDVREARRGDVLVVDDAVAVDVDDTQVAALDTVAVDGIVGMVGDLLGRIVKAFVVIGLVLSVGEARFVHPGVHVGGFGLVVDLVDGIGDLSAHFIPEIRADVVAPRDLYLVTPVAHAPHIHGRQGVTAQADDARRDPQFGEDVVALLLEQVDRDGEPIAEHAHLGGDVVRLLLLPRDVGVACRLFVFAGEGRVIDRTVR